jgi:deoxyribose-phosphate aldolase
LELKLRAHDANLKERILTLIDLTSLADTDTDVGIRVLCDKALAAPVPVAAVCVYPRFIKTVTERLKNSAIKCAAVANFPTGDAVCAEVIDDIKKSIAAGLPTGVQEIDVVFPYKSFLQGAKSEAQDFIRQCKAACGADVLLKVILESGALPAASIAEAAQLVIAAGANFVKTSTGKISIGATLEAAEIILQTIKKSKLAVGFKVSGGVRSIEQAEDYLNLANHIMGREWVSPATFRIGASQLFDVLSAAPSCVASMGVEASPPT